MGGADMGGVDTGRVPPDCTGGADVTGGADTDAAGGADTEAAGGADTDMVSSVDS